MGKPLTQPQIDFINKYIVNLNKKQKAATIEAFRDFVRRGDKIKLEVAKLPDGDPKTALQKRFDAADKKGRGKKSQGGEFAAAYKDMAAIKTDARAAAKGYTKSLSPAKTKTSLDEFDQLLADVTVGWTEAERDVQALIEELKAVKVPELKDLAAIEKHRRAMTKHQARWIGDLKSARDSADNAAAAADVLDAEPSLKDITHDIAQLKAKGDKKATKTLDALSARADTSDAAARMSDGKFFTSANIQAGFAKLEAEANALIRLRLTPQNRETAPNTGDRFKHLEETEKARLQKALGAYSEAFANDADVLDPDYDGADVNPRGPPPRVKFDTSDLIPEAVAGLGEDEIDEGRIPAIATLLGNNARQFVGIEANRNPNSDKLFDFTMKSLNDLRQEIGATLGLTGDPAEWPPKSLKLAEAGAKAMKAAVIANSPNKVSNQTVKLKLNDTDYDVPQDITLNGQQYDRPELLGKGGLGLITRYKKTGTEETVVVKSTIATSGDDLVPLDHMPDDVRKRAELVKELEAHRALMGGENHQPPPNVIELKGVALGANGGLHMVMEEAGAGDAEGLGHAVSALTRGGVLPKAAQHALQQDTMLQAMRGMKAVHGLGMLHNDIKALNFFVADDGQVKTGDFGSAYTMDDGVDENVPNPFVTSMFDWDSGGAVGKRNEKTDIYQLGCMLHGMASELGVDQTTERAKWGSKFRELADSEHDATSLDRLRNAMLEKDPKNRPTLDGILMSSYLNDAQSASGGSNGPALVALRKAMAAYTKAVGRELANLNRQIAVIAGDLDNAFDGAGDDPVRLAAAEQTATEAKKKIEAIQVKIDEVNKRPDVVTLLDAIRTASAPFGQTKGDVEEQAWDFAYRKTEYLMRNINRPDPRLNRAQRRAVRGGAELRNQQASQDANPT